MRRATTQLWNLLRKAVTPKSNASRISRRLKCDGEVCPAENSTRNGESGEPWSRSPCRRGSLTHTVMSHGKCKCFIPTNSLCAECAICGWHRGSTPSALPKHKGPWQGLNSLCHDKEKTQGRCGAPTKAMHVGDYRSCTDRDLCGSHVQVT